MFRRRNFVGIVGGISLLAAQVSPIGASNIYELASDEISGLLTNLTRHNYTNVHCQPPSEDTWPTAAVVTTVGLGITSTLALCTLCKGFYDSRLATKSYNISKKGLQRLEQQDEASARISSEEMFISDILPGRHKMKKHRGSILDLDEELVDSGWQKKGIVNDASYLLGYEYASGENMLEITLKPETLAVEAECLKANKNLGLAIYHDPKKYLRPGYSSRRIGKKDSKTNKVLYKDKEHFLQKARLMIDSVFGNNDKGISFILNGLLDGKFSEKPDRFQGEIVVRTRGMGYFFHNEKQETILQLVIKREAHEV